MNVIELILAVIVIKILYSVIMTYRRNKFIRTFKFPQRVADNVRKTYPHLSDEELDQVLDGLRDYFLMMRGCKGTMVAMPSRVVDVAWHEFILFTRQYQAFCRKGLGYFLHHNPLEDMTPPGLSSMALKEAWYRSCRQQDIDSKLPNMLPKLFAMDMALKIPDGFHYTLDGSLAQGGYDVTLIGCVAAGCGGGGCGGG